MKLLSNKEVISNSELFFVSTRKSVAPSEDNNTESTATVGRQKRSKHVFLPSIVSQQQHIRVKFNYTRGSCLHKMAGIFYPEGKPNFCSDFGKGKGDHIFTLLMSNLSWLSSSWNWNWKGEFLMENFDFGNELVILSPPLAPWPWSSPTSNKIEKLNFSQRTQTLDLSYYFELIVKPRPVVSRFIRY